MASYQRLHGYSLKSLDDVSLGSRRVLFAVVSSSFHSKQSTRKTIGTTNTTRSNNLYKRNLLYELSSLFVACLFEVGSEPINQVLFKQLRSSYYARQPSAQLGVHLAGPRK
jgi:hypothetical protein